MIQEARIRQEERKRARQEAMAARQQEHEIERQEEEELERARAEIEQWRNEHWDKMLRESTASQQATKVSKPSMILKEVAPLNEEDAIDDTKLAETEREGEAAKKKAKAAAKRQRAKERKKQQKEQERKDAEK